MLGGQNPPLAQLPDQAPGRAAAFLNSKQRSNKQGVIMPNRKIPIAILGATGAVGQRMIQLLAGHPWFEIAERNGSDRAVGRQYGELVRWVLDDAPPADIARMVVQPSDTVQDVAIALSALPTEVA